MAKCKCGSRTRIVSDVVQSIGKCSGNCQDICASPICMDPNVLGIMAPLIYDEIGINLCAGFDLGVDVPTTYPTATSATIKVINATYTYGDGGITVESITGRQNCYTITLSNITVQFAVSLYDAACRLVATIYPTAVYLPSDTTAPTYNEDTNPTSVQLDLFAPYGFSYTAGATPTPVVNFVGASEDNNTIQQGVNLFAMAKILDFSTEDSSVTAGITLVLQSLYYAGYKVKSEGKIDIPKGSILTPEDSDCLRFVAGDLLNLAIKPLDLGYPSYDEKNKKICCSNDSECNGCSGCNNCAMNDCDSPCSNLVADDTTEVPVTPPTP